jgi:hypothetical protein
VNFCGAPVGKVEWFDSQILTRISVSGMYFQN